VAYQAFAEDGWGRLVPGASADLLWLNRDPRITAALELPALDVQATYLRGRPAYTATD
jgi:predicted amidohydrolase YtcJ